jgi:rRNA maturation endonuclease Nob1
MILLILLVVKKKSQPIAVNATAQAPQPAYPTPPQATTQQPVMQSTISMLHCTNCGTKINESEKFCKECGTPTPKPTLTECPACKAPLAPGTKFCAECGYNINTPS